MRLFKSVKSIAIIGALAALSFPAWAQSYRLPGAHAEQHRDLIAGQTNINNQIKVEATQTFIDNLFDQEEEPEMDIYEEGWNSRLVNPFAGMDVPDMRDIDVSRFAMPVPGYVTSPYGYRKRFKRMHKGVDLKLYTGDTVRAAFDGKVRLTNFERKGYGNYVILRHPNELETVYGHLSKFLVEPDQYVKAGDPIGLGGNTGRSFGAHLHFETRFMGYAINPAAIFDFVNQTVHTDTYTFNKKTYQEARNFDPAANSQYAQTYLKEHPQPAASKSSKSSSNSGSSKSATVTVKKGDTLSKIATRNGISLRQLCKLNGLTTHSTIKPGQKLKIK